MRGKRLLFASPLIAALAFGTVDTAQATAAPTSASAGNSHLTPTSNMAPPTCRQNFAEAALKECAQGYDDGYEAGLASCNDLHSHHHRALTPEIQNMAYGHGYEAGKERGRAKC
ncbi:hypothetical protein [Acrocarpospora catenulata]|uniref:hypothetical protein n=1 Tax=Acrocarpospora catenulata TaxID=2836182 RepID=UPI001BDA7975|nr:hypothetical protein [Acrocarpospora catenulata]